MIHQITENNIAILTFDFGKGNAFAKSNMLELIQLLNIIENEEKIKGLIITGSNRAFSIGGNVEEIYSLSSIEDKADFFRVMDDLLLNLFSFRKPVVSAINGHTVGLGFLLMLCSDACYFVKNEKIKLGLPEITIGMTIDDLMIEILEYNNLKGKILAKILLTGELFGMEIAKQLGLIDFIVEQHENLLNLSKDQIEKFLQYGSLSFELNKKRLKQKTIQSLRDHIQNDCYFVFVDALHQKTISL